MPANKAHREAHKRKAEIWVRQHLSAKYGVRPAKLNMSDTLKDWGFDDEKSLAELAGDFNRETLKQKDWKGADVAPPKLIANVKGQTVGHLASFLGGETAARKPPTGPRLKSWVLQWLIDEVNGSLNTHDVDQTSVFGPYPNVSLQLANIKQIEGDFVDTFGRPDGQIIANSAGHTVFEVAISLYQLVK